MPRLDKVATATEFSRLLLAPKLRHHFPLSSFSAELALFHSPPQHVHHDNSTTVITANSKIWVDFTRLVSRE